MIGICICWVAILKANIVHNGVTYEVKIDREAEHPLQVWDRKSKVDESLRRAYHPWALQVVDVDGDDVEEIAVGLTKATKRLAKPHRTLFIMRFDGHQIVRKWAGSTMGRPLIEFCFSPKQAQKPQLLFTLERKPDGDIALSGHRWTGFGFQKVGRERHWKHASGLNTSRNHLSLIADNRDITFNWKELL